MKKELRKAIESCGWSIHSDTSIESYSPAGEDLWIECAKDETIIEAIESEYNNFDVDEHVDLWVESRGKNGVPSSCRELVEDAEAIKEMLETLYNAVMEVK